MGYLFLALAINPIEIRIVARTWARERNSHQGGAKQGVLWIWDRKAEVASYPLKKEDLNRKFTERPLLQSEDEIIIG